MQRTTWLSAALLCLVLSACDMDIKETLGLNRKGPDAFQVYSRPPLTVPPEFDLQAPGKGPEITPNVSAETQAHTQLLGAGDAAAAAPIGALNSPTTGSAATAVPAVSANDLPTNADAQFLSDVGATKADPKIREEIERDKETGATPKSSAYLFDGKTEGDPVVDSTKETERLKQDKQQDKPPTTGDTPVITPQDKGILGGIF